MPRSKKEEEFTPPPTDPVEKRMVAIDPETSIEVLNQETNEVKPEDVEIATPRYGAESIGTDPTTTNLVNTYVEKPVDLHSNPPVPQNLPPFAPAPPAQDVLIIEPTVNENGFATKAMRAMDVLVCRQCGDQKRTNEMNQIICTQGESKDCWFYQQEQAKLQVYQQTRSTSDDPNAVFDPRVQSVAVPVVKNTESK